MARIQSLACLLGTAALALTALGDVAVMRTGVVHEGTLNHFDTDELELTIQSGRIILDREDIASVHFGLTAAQYKRRFNPGINPPPTNPPPTDPHTHPPAAPINAPEGTRVGQPYDGGHFTLTLVSARIDKPRLRDLFDMSQVGADPELILTFGVTNTHARRILRYEEPNPFLGGHFSMTDDATNTIRTIDYGLGTTVVGALDGDVDIMPGQQAQHVEVFSVPPPLTRSLVLRLKNSAFGGSGVARFVIIPSEITGFQATSTP